MPLLQHTPPSLSRDQLSGSYSIKFVQVRAFMNRGFLGESCCLPLPSDPITSKREGSCDGRIYPRWANARHLRFIDNELYICNVRTISYRVDSIIWRPEDVRITANNRVMICDHTFTGRSLYPSDRDRKVVKGLDRPLFPSSDLFTRCIDDVGSCTVCYTDYDLTILWDKSPACLGDEGWTITLRSYHRLGVDGVRRKHCGHAVVTGTRIPEA